MATAAPGASRYTGTNPFLKGLIWGDRWEQSRSDPITYSFSWEAGDPPIPATQPWLPNGTPAAAALFEMERTAYRKALESWASVANLSFARTPASTDADIRFFKVDSDFMQALGVPPTYLAIQNGPNGDPEMDGIGFYNWEVHPHWGANLKVGGYSYLTLVHETGHALGLAHPHTTGGSSVVWKGALKRQDDVINTVMSYNDVGRPWAPSGFVDHGFVSGPMAMDIAAVQTIYGARHKATGDSTYVIPDTDSAKRYYTSIWDTGGTDRIIYHGSKDAVIDLRGATLDRNDPHAGGHLSGLKDADGDWIKGNGGFTIAKDFGSFKVRIENASGGRGDDEISGNEAANRLLGGAGDDALHGREGGDMLAGGAGKDTLLGGAGRDVLRGGAGEDTFTFAQTADAGIGARRDVVLDFQSGTDTIDLSALDAELDRNGNQRFAWVDAAILDAAFTGEAGQLRFADGVLMGDLDGDRWSDFQIRIVGGLTPDDVIV